MPDCLCCGEPTPAEQLVDYLCQPCKAEQFDELGNDPGLDFDAEY